jgi:serine/threonine protein kinase
MVFELVTGDYMFDPKKGKTYKKNDDHLAQISELIGECKDNKFLDKCEAREDFFTKGNKLKRIKSLKLWGLLEVLTEKYRVRWGEAYFLAKFLMRMLKWNPKQRHSAKDLLEDPWFRMADNYDTVMPRAYHREWRQAYDDDYSSSSESSSGSSGSNKSSNGEGEESEYETDREGFEDSNKSASEDDQ